MNSFDSWTPVGDVELEPNAKNAIFAHDSNTIISAGPGAGKTELLAQKADFLLSQGLVRYPKRILAISFKVDAAANLRERVLLRSGTGQAARFDSMTFHAFAKRLIDNYRPTLTGSDALDPDYSIGDVQITNQQITFGEMVPLAIEILKNNQYAKAALRQTYSHVFLDEFQDATTHQYSLVKEAFLATTQLRPVLTAVGDDKQRIMGWAGALTGIMKTFETDFQATPLQLYQNFRSLPKLRRVQNRMVLQMDPAAAAPEKMLQGDDGNVEILSFDDADAEAVTIADKVSDWLSQGVPPSEIAILARQQPHLIAGQLVDEISGRGIAIKNDQALQDLLSEPVAEFMITFLRVVIDERRPKEYVKLSKYFLARNEINDQNVTSNNSFRHYLASVRRKVRAKDFDSGDPEHWLPIAKDLVEHISRPVLKSLSPSYQQGDRLRELLNKTWEEFAKELTSAGDPIVALDRLSHDDSIRLLTIHKCKGLEFEKVVVLGVEEGFFWGKQAEVFSEFFVAISRAKNDLILTTADYRPAPEGASYRWQTQTTPHGELLDFALES